jgi:stage V sporulation protein D (sporulation-specific penicillin-binding protein)
MLFVFIFLLFGIILVRLFWLQIISYRFFQEKSIDQRTRIINLSSSRGDLLDRNGEILASSIDTYSVFTQKKRFSWVGRKLSLAQAQKLQSANPRELFFLKEKKRFYPKGESASQLLGFVGADNQGLSGIELAWEKYLKGKVGRVVTEGDPEGRELYRAPREIEPGSDGMNITLTIDQNLQYIAERELAAQIKRSSAAGGMLLVIDAKNGEILALASKPDFDPNNYNRFAQPFWHPRFLDPYEPGSTFKLITTAAGLEEGVISPESKLKSLDQIEVGGKIISNSHQIKWTGAEISISKMLEESINTGAVQIGLKMGPERFYQRIKKFGFGEATEFGLEGESKGILAYWKNWYKPDIAMLTFGQSIAVTPLQLMSAVSAFANQGKMVRPFLIKKIESADGKFVKHFTGEFRGEAVSKQTATQMLELMRQVVQKGSGRRAQMDWFSVGGKTGTAQKAAVGGRGYLKGRYIASFIGLAPLAEPKIMAMVIIDDPRGVIWGETVGGPVFKMVVEHALRYLNVRPDVL